MSYLCAYVCVCVHSTHLVFLQTSREELTTMLTAILQSTNTILHTIAQEDTALMHGENTDQAVKRMVNAAFTHCDISRTGKLLPLVSGRDRVSSSEQS